MRLREAVTRHAALLCERELARRTHPRRVHDAVREVMGAVARGLADAAAADATVRQTLEEIYLTEARHEGAIGDRQRSFPGLSMPRSPS